MNPLALIMSCGCFNIENQPMIQSCISKLYFTYMTDEQKKKLLFTLKISRTSSKYE